MEQLWGAGGSANEDPYGIGLEKVFQTLPSDLN